MAKGEFTPHDVRVYGALNNAIRLGLRELGLKNKAKLPNPVADLNAIAAEIAGA